MRGLIAGLRVLSLLATVGLTTFALASAWVAPPGPFIPVAEALDTPPPQAALPAATETGQPSPHGRRGVYLTANAAADGSRLDAVIAQSLARGFNAIVIDVKDAHGEVAYPSQVPLARQLGAVVPRFSLEALVRRVHARGLYLIARLVVFSDPKLAKRLGRPDPWVLPHEGTAVGYNLALAEEVAAAGVDEIQFDYIRFPDGDPLGVPYPDRVEAVVNFLRQAQARLGGRVALSADVYGRTLWDWNPQGTDPIGQVLERMAPFVDYLSPMIYPSHYEAYFQSRPYEVVKRGMGVGLERGLPLRPFLQAFEWRVPASLSLPQYIRAQLRALEELGVEGYLFWNPRGDYTGLWQALPRP